tara:strand:- start:522 stop:1604 length:1083 start_codon:yes stop_codon:yes gene_type:complete
MAYTDIDDPTIYFNTITWTGAGDSSARSFTGVGFQPDWVWYKCRSDTYNHNFVDVVRGTGLNSELCSNLTVAEGGGDSSTHGYLSSFDTDGFSSANGSSNNLEFNQNGDTFVAWNWKAGGTASSNTDGSITSNVSANTTAGLSIVSYTGNGTDGATVGHGLTSPKLVLIKDRDNSTPWLMYGFPNHPTFTTDGDLIKLNLTDALVSNDSTTELSIGSSTVTFVDAGSAINASSTDFIMYCFQEIKGYSSFGTYQGNGNADGAFIYTGFLPAMVIIKRTDTAGYAWRIVDNKRLGYNGASYSLNPNDNTSEGTSDRLNFVSNGIKLTSSATSFNASGGTYIYMAFAKSPFTNSNGVPNNAR